MKRQPVSFFVHQQFFPALLAMTLAAVVKYVGDLVGSVVTARMIGELCLSAINLVVPFWKVSFFLSMLISGGMIYMIGEAMGDFDGEATGKYFSLSLMLAVIVGLLAYFGSSAILPVYLGSLQLTEDLIDLAEQYFSVLRFAILIQPVAMVMTEACFTDGDARLMTVGYVANVLVNIAVTLWACPTMGVMGAGLGLFLGLAAQMLVCCIHFFKRTNALRFRWRVPWRQVKSLLLYAMPDAVIHFCQMGTTLLLDYWLVFNFGSAYLPVLTVVFFVLDLVFVFDAVGEAFTPIATVYLGEKSYTNEGALISFSLVIALSEGILMAVLLYFFAPLIPQFLEIRNPGLIRYSVTAIRILTFAMPILSALMVFTSQFTMVERVGLSSGMTVVKDFLILVPLAIVFSWYMGIPGIMVGILVSYCISAVLLILHLWRHHQDTTFPWLVPLSTCPNFTCGCRVNLKNIKKVMDKTHRFLIQQPLDASTRNRVELLIEEISMLLAEKNPGDRRLVMEYSIFVREEDVQVILKNSGRPLDLTVEDETLDNFRAYFVASLMDSSSYRERQYLMAMGFNRNRFIFPRKPAESHEGAPQ